MQTVAVVYAKASKVIRRIIVSDEADAAEIANPGPGEVVMAVPFDQYSKQNDAELRAFVAAQIGEPGPDRCVELNAKGLVVAAYHADPELDRPLDAANTMEFHDRAGPGDVKMVDSGEFVSTTPVEIPEKSDVAAFYASKGVPQEEAEILADAVIADQVEQSAARDEALAQIT